MQKVLWHFVVCRYGGQSKDGHKSDIGIVADDWGHIFRKIYGITFRLSIVVCGKSKQF